MGRRDREEMSMGERRRKNKPQDGGGMGRSCFKPPSNLPQFKVDNAKSAELSLDFLPSTAGKTNQVAKKGEMYYEYTYFYHGNIGPNNGRYLCNLSMFKKPCFVCEYRQKKYGGIPASERTKESKSAYGKLLPKQRQIFLVRNADKPKKGLHWLDTSTHVFGTYLDGKLENAKKPEIKKQRDNFADPKKGSTLVISTTIKPAGDGKYAEMSSIEFQKRDEPLPSDLVKQAKAIVIDKWFKPEDYNELKKAFLGGAADDDEEEDDEDEDEKDWEEDDEDSDDEDEDEDDKPRKKKGKKKSSKKKDEDEDEDDEDSDDDDDSDSDDEDDDSDDDEDSDEDDEDADSDDDEDDDEPRKKKKRK